MLRVAGLCCLFLAALYGGRLACDRYRTRLAALRGFWRLVTFMEEQISCFRLETGEIRARFAAKEGDDIPAFGEFLMLWESGDFSPALQGTGAALGLCEQDYAALVDFGEQLGRGSYETALQSCARCREYLSEAVEKAEGELPKQLRLARVISLCAGGMAVLMLL